MSQIVRSYGFIAELEVPFSTEYDESLELYETQREEFSEKLSDDDSILGITYDGKCVYCDFNKHDRYKGDDVMFTQVGTPELNIKTFVSELNKYHLRIKPNTEKPYNCVWYTGCDFPIDTLTVEQVQNNYCDD